MMELTAALRYAQSIINWDKNDAVIVQLKKDEINFNCLSINKGLITKLSESKKESVNVNSNPIKRMIEFIEQEVCLECLETDYLFKDPFFVSLIKAYVETIIIRYGSKVSISQPMAHAIIKHELTDYIIVCKTLHEEIILDSSNYQHYDSEKCIYYLIQNDRVREIQSD